jgi:toxin YoeB
MRVVFTQQGWNDLIWWYDQDRTNVFKVLDLLRDCQRDPWKGVGKPEPLKHLKPNWSRRIDKAHRLIYQVSGKDESYQLMIVACRGHYDG